MTYGSIAAALGGLSQAATMPTEAATSIEPSVEPHPGCRGRDVGGRVRTHRDAAGRDHLPVTHTVKVFESDPPPLARSAKSKPLVTT